MLRLEAYQALVWRDGDTVFVWAGTRLPSGVYESRDMIVQHVATSSGLRNSSAAWGEEIRMEVWLIQSVVVMISFLTALS